MNALTTLLMIFAMVVIYRQASGAANYNKWIVMVLALLFILPSLIVATIGWRKNPRKADGDSWTTALDGSNDK